MCVCGGLCIFAVAGVVSLAAPLAGQEAARLQENDTTKASQADQPAEQCQVCVKELKLLPHEGGEESTKFDAEEEGRDEMPPLLFADYAEVVDHDGAPAVIYRF
eukprot:CAMPEP_0196719342 /NCGR_PEP_ID=MMETSP1091-20130531/2347_1 /TAXON_ID=302021 /ORGANISM="Rhodomonas sp., Strain CCMP768" /LENGTH=103 /DNA_ID=CAMNT_0042060269 /DNA_START=63 /DNA_END=374 /DNA_ORIENTATION=-